MGKSEISWYSVKCVSMVKFFIVKLIWINAGQDMTIVGEPCNVDAHANFSALFMTNVCPRLCVHMYCAHCTYRCLVDRSQHLIHPGDTTHDTHKTHTDKVKCWAWVPRLTNSSLGKILDLFYCKTFGLKRSYMVSILKARKHTKRIGSKKDY